ncbi:primase-helicase family protein [Glaciimonas sp. GNP009]
MTSLSIVPNKVTPTVLPSAEILRRLAADLIAESWCIDLSAFPHKALHADSNYNASIDYFRFDFRSWAHKNNVRVESKEYSVFLRSLTDSLIPLMPRVLGSSFYPATNYDPIKDKFFKSRSGALLANTYVPFKPPAPAAPQEIPAILDEYLNRIFANAQDRKIVVQWLADIIQNPSRRPMWSVVLTGVQGSGKSSIFRLVSLALGGRHTWEKNDYGAALKQFSEVLPDNLLVSFDDARNAPDTYQKLKQAITCTSQQVELKFVQKLVHREVYARVLVCSNSPRPLRIEEGDRRLYCAEPSKHKENPEETAAFFVGFNAWLDRPTAPTILYHFFMGIDLSDFVHGSTTQTETHAKMVGLSTTVLENLLLDFVEGEPIFYNSNLVSHLTANGIKYPEPDLLKLKLADIGYVQARRKVDGCGDKQIYVWQKDCTRSRKLTQAEIDSIKTAVNLTF